MNKTLVTGGTGYVGRHLIDSLLDDGVPVRALVYSDWKGEELVERGVEVVYGDVTRPETLAGIAQGVDTVFHLVGGGSDGRTDPFGINTEGTRHVMDACQSAGLRAFVYTSSSSVYGRQPEPVDEETPPAPRFNYPGSKLAAEKLLLERAGATGFPAVVARMGGVYGPDAPILGTHLVRRGQMRITGDGQNVISVIHVDDAVRALRAMAGYAGRGGATRLFCLCDDEAVGLYHFHSYFAGLLGAPAVRTTPINRVRLVMGALRVAAWITGQHPPAAEALIEMSTLNVQMSNHLVRRELGLAPQYSTYREGLEQVVAWLRAEEEEE